MRRAPVGIGLRQPHITALLETRPPQDFVEVHSENHLAPGGAARAVLHQVRQHMDISLHGVSLGLGSATGLDRSHLRRLAHLVADIDPLLVSDHACFCRADQDGQPFTVHSGDLLPIAFTDASLALLVAHVHTVQDTLKRPLLVENISAYLRYADDAWEETDFLQALCQRSGCQLLLDVNNLVVNALNWSCTGDHAEVDACQAIQASCDWIDRISPAHVGQIHLAGHRPPAHPRALVVDDHSQAVNASVWRTYEHALQRLGPRPTLIEWDVDLPPLELLLEQARLATLCMDASSPNREPRA